MIPERDFKSDTLTYETYENLYRGVSKTLATELKDGDFVTSGSDAMGKVIEEAERDFIIKATHAKDWDDAKDKVAKLTEEKFQEVADNLAAADEQVKESAATWAQNNSLKNALVDWNMNND